MSLQVWLPLNGDLHNQGLANINLTQGSGVNIISNGKIGNSCYNFSGSNSYLRFNNPFTTNLTTFSVAGWICLNEGYTANNGIHIISFNTGSSYARICISKDGAAVTVLLTSPNTKVMSTMAASSLVANVWHHYVVTYNSGTVKIYIDGILDKSQETSVTTFTTSATYVIGTHASETANARLNDFRLYNHALSAKEVEEMAKGLVLHYKMLNQNPYIMSGQENLFIGSGYSSTDIANFVVNSSTDWTKPLRFYNGSAAIHSFANGIDTITLNSTANLGIAFVRKATDIALDSNSYYTISCEAQCTSTSKPFCIGLSYYTTGNAWTWRGGSNGQNFTAANTWQTFTLTFKPDANTQYICYCFTVATGGNNTLQIRNCKLEKGSTATAYELNKADAGYANQRGAYTKELDVSGYGHHATIINTITETSDTARYGAAAHFTSTAQHAKVSGLTTTGFSDSYSIAWWGKINTFSSKMFWGFADGVRLNGIYNGILWNTGDSSNNPLYKPGTTTAVTAPSVNEWHHYVMTGNGSQCLVYLDGVLWGQAKTYKQITGTTIYFNGWGESGTTYATDNMFISDFRIYATPLTTEQVKELYNTSASIDKNGNIYAREFNNINVSDKFQINHRGQMIPVDKFIERDEKLASITKNDDVLGGYFYEY